MPAVLATVKEYLRSFGATSQVDDENAMSEKDFDNEDNASESTDVGSTDSFTDAHPRRSRSALQSNISSDDFKQFYRRLSDLQSSQANVCPEGFRKLPQEVHGISEKCSLEKPTQDVKSPAVQAHRGCFGRAWRLLGEPSPNAQDREEVFAILAEQIY
mmetsp:Transcript_27030/g.43252  ORF Transcript_27030/g.43252 Transcript_27030/m.43252 type:complete len:158 (+) Transcript_27030:92-565(+)